MATRSPKAPKTAPKKAAKPAAAKAPKAKKEAKPKGKAPKGKAGKDGKGGRKPVMVYEDARTGEQVVAFVEERPGFFERLRARRAERAEHKAAERARRDQERAAERLRAEEERLQEEARARLLEQEQRALREEHERQEAERREAEERERQAAEAAEARRAKAAERREQKRQEKDAEEARKAEEAIAKAAEEARQAEEKARADAEAKARRAAEREAKRQELEDEERRKAMEQAKRDAEEEAEREAERRRKAVQEKLKAEREAAEAEAAAKRKPRELEPEMEFQEASKPVAPGREVVPKDGAAAGGSAADVQADLMVAELSRRRSKPIVLDEELPEPPKIPKAPLRPGEEWRDAPKPAAQETVTFTEETPSAPAEAFGFAVPEAFLLLAADGQWDERMEKNKEGAYGGALAGAILLELLMAGAIQVQRDRFIPTGTVPDDPSLYAALDRLRRVRDKKGDLATLRMMGELAKWNRELLRPYKDSLAARGLAEHGDRRHLGVFYRSWLQVTDVDAQERLQNRLRRAIAGGGTPEPHSVLLLGLLDASGQFGTVVPDEAADYNRKRLNGLLGGRDIMGYKVHPDLKALQEVAVRTILANVRIMTVRG